MSEETDHMTRVDAFRELAGLKGQAYVLPQKADQVLTPFEEFITEEYAERFDVEDYPELAFPKAIAEKQTVADDARGLPTVPAYQPILTGHEVSEILVEAIGEEPSDATMGGAGFTADKRHKENIDTAAEELDDEIDYEAE